MLWSAATLTNYGSSAADEVTGRYSQLAGAVETIWSPLHRLGDNPLRVSDQGDEGVAVIATVLTDPPKKVMAKPDETRAASDLPVFELPI